MIKSIIQDASVDPVFCLKVGSLVTPGNKVAQLSQKISTSSDPQSDLFKVAISTFRKVEMLMKQSNLSKNEKLELFWRKIHLFVLDDAAVDLWHQCVCQRFDYLVTVETTQSLFQFIVMNLVKLLLKHHAETNALLEPDVDVKLTEEEQKVVRYVGGGFIVFPMLKKYRQSAKTANAAVQFFNTLKTVGLAEMNCHSFLDFTKEWVSAQSRGWLVNISDDFFIFIRTIENRVRKVLTLNFMAKYRGEDLRAVIEDELKKSQLINTYWDSLARNLPSKQLKDVLKTQIINKWIDIRVRAFVSSYVLLLKRTLVKQKNPESLKIQLSKKGEPSMRNTLT